LGCCIALPMVTPTALIRATTATTAINLVFILSPLHPGDARFQVWFGRAVDESSSAQRRKQESTVGARD
jgi:hypothetical protein